MKKMKKLVSFVLVMCMFLTLLPPMQFTHAAEVVQRYELDTDGIDVGATYLIVNAGTAGSGNALRFYYENMWNRDLQNQALTIQSKDGTVFIESGFTNENNCQFQFTGTNAGRVTHGNYSLELSESRYESANAETLSFTDLGGGQYRIHCSTSGWWNTTTYYLRYSNSRWTGSTTTASVYLFKLTEQVVGYDVTFDGNGYTAGTLPENVTNLSSGHPFEIPEPPTELRKDVGEDTWLFAGWNTKPDGSGTEYDPDETITVTEDITLYAQWYQQTKYSVSMLTYLDNELTDVRVTAGYDKQFFAHLEDSDGPYISLTRRDAGIYSAKVVDNGTYGIYTQTEEGEYESVHGHTVVIYGQDGTTECMHYSVNYNTNGGAWTQGEEPPASFCHYGEAVTAWDKIPTMQGNRFLYWQDQNGKQYAPGQRITESATETITLTAQWEKLITVTVDVVIDHNAITGGVDMSDTMHQVTFTLLREENGVNLPVKEMTLNSKDNLDQDTNITTYHVTFTDMPQGIYHVASTKTHYEGSTSRQGDANGNQTVSVLLQYNRITSIWSLMWSSMPRTIPKRH